MNSNQKNHEGPRCLKCKHYTETIAPDLNVCRREYCRLFGIPVDDRGMPERRQPEAASPYDTSVDRTARRSGR